MLEMLASFAVSFFSKLVLEWFEERCKIASAQETGRLHSELEHALESLKRQQEMAQIAARLATRADVLARLDEGSI